MRLRRKPPQLSNSRRQRPDSDLPRSPSKFAYRASRSDGELNIGRNTAGETIKSTHATLRRFLLQRFGLLVLLVALVISAVNILSLSTEVRVMPLVSGTSASFLHDKSQYQAAASQLVASSIWNHNKLTIDTAHINQQLLSQFPELSSASITLPLLSKRPIVYLQVTEPILILATRDGSFVLDGKGKALLLTGNLSSSVRLSLPVVTDQSGLRVRLNHQALTTDDVSFIQTVSSQLAAKQQTIVSMVLPTASSELDVRVSAQPYAIKFNLQSANAREQVGTFLATQAKLKSQNITPSQYIDVRVNGRAYYK